MSWYHKEYQTRLEHLPIEGLFFLCGDILAHQEHFFWAEGLKSPMMHFPSGVSLPAEWDAEGNPAVYLFPDLDLPLLDTYESAFERVSAITEDGWFSFFGSDATQQLELWSHQTEQVFFVTYDSAAGRLVDVQISAT